MDTFPHHLEKQFDFVYKPDWNWMSQNWPWSIYIVLAYLASIHVGQLWMRQRKRFEFRLGLTLWNLGIAIFSICATLSVVPDLVSSSLDKGLHHTINFSPEVIKWGNLFAASKAIELADTAFIVLRKQPLTFLHWYHHTTVLVFTWFAWTHHVSLCRWFGAMNFFVHSLMYTYYALKSLRISVPKTVAMAITTLQLAQMVAGVGLNVIAALALAHGRRCDVSWRHINAGLGMYATYLLLFIHFFYRAYFSKKIFVTKKIL